MNILPSSLRFLRLGSRCLWVAIWFSLAAVAKEPVTEFKVVEATVSEIQAALLDRRLTARQLVQLYLDRIAAFDQKGPAIRCIISLDPSAMAEAERLDAELARTGQLTGPLHGVVVLVKDEIDVAGTATTQGVKIFANYRPPRDAFVVAKLRKAGAIILGKTTLSEFAGGDTYSTLFGHSRNPYALDRNPSGSSSGTAAAVAASLAAVGVGTETDGSIVSPAQVNGLVGIKPTLGLVSRTGIVPIAHSQDTAGPMARTVADAAVLLTAMAAPDPSDPPTTERRRVQSDYTRALDPNGLKGARIGVVRNRLFGSHAATDTLANAAIEVLRQQGATIVDPANIPTLGQFDDTEL